MAWTDKEVCPTARVPCSPLPLSLEDRSNYLGGGYLKEAIRGGEAERAGRKAVLNLTPWGSCLGDRKYGTSASRARVKILAISCMTKVAQGSPSVPGKIQTEQMGNTVCPRQNKGPNWPGRK